jgi:hypothetical protein
MENSSEYAGLMLSGIAIRSVRVARISPNERGANEKPVRYMPRQTWSWRKVSQSLERPLVKGSRLKWFRCCRKAVAGFTAGKPARKGPG